jgi:hypothetical protein
MNQSRVGKQYLIDGQLHICLEDNGDRGLFQFVSDMPINPTAVYSFTDDMEEVK